MEEKVKTNIHDLFSSAAERKTYLKICAPMVRYSKLEFRNLVRSYGTDIAFTSMIMADSFCRSEKARLNEFTTNKDDTPLIAQFAANNVTDFLSATEMVYPYVDGVDLNCGCPQRWAMKEGYGSAMLKNPEMIADLLGTVRRNMPNSFSVSVKVRLLSSTHLKETIEMCRQLEATGISFLTVHGRTAAEKTNVPVHKDALREIKQSIAIPMVANGDIFTLDDAEQMHRETQCDGVMTARGILSNPALFAGDRSTPVGCVKRWLSICQQADTDITYQCMHHHFSFMTESLLPKKRRVQLNNLAKDKEKVYEFIRTYLPLDLVACSDVDHPAKISCSYSEANFRKRLAENGDKIGHGSRSCTYDSEASDGNFFQSKRAELGETDQTEDGLNDDGVDFMDGGAMFDE
ncbi:tRNA-dihydrouridine(20a/20b) synthase [NAD(P)+]-like [Anopheles ziemanni]|uniref:tRNA-dihydrouridine(20a/20b) synthase [NAD(P)+]-like n=1 Tax=Anopheles coustani TaxID=139045 RepID=UPI00265A63DA|nr:tRNA-dihydrouridine(20a/20b) synthase [NAD(P)+]-like [Anopheles coustani]XP_058169313.1 tRNA-dihydrouridine(20a/20b) synthase [NAD(P)+]-like [Anopheles ziemanni]